MIHIAEFKRRADLSIEALQTLINMMPQKGDKAEDCQRVCLQQHLNELDSAITGTEAEDLEGNTHTCPECGWEGGRKTRCPECHSKGIERIGGGKW